MRVGRKDKIQYFFRNVNASVISIIHILLSYIVLLYCFTHPVGKRLFPFNLVSFFFLFFLLLMYFCYCLPAVKIEKRFNS